MLSIQRARLAASAVSTSTAFMRGLSPVFSQDRSTPAIAAHSRVQA
jgi:hypothetical protein